MSTQHSLTTAQRWRALLRQRCPRCGAAPLFRSAFTMHETCLACELRFEREPGYFLGSMYISYGIGMVVVGLLMGGLYLMWPDLDLGVMVLIAGVLFVPLVPWAWRWSRTLWIFFDHWASPHPKKSAD
jgi:uncharacterized protein (DUF983 family)